MYKKYQIKEPFFEYGPKCYMYGDELLEIARGLDRLADKYDVDIIMDVADTEIANVARNTKRIHVFSQHMSNISVGKGMGRTLPEAVKAAGAVGVMLNHAEHKLTLEDVKEAIQRADEVGLATMVCADSLEEVREIAKLGPNILVAEPSELIGTGKPADKEYVDSVIKCIREINPDIKPFPSAGVSKPEDCYNIIKAGSSASGCSSAIAKADNPLVLAEEMIAAVRRGWNELHGIEVKGLKEETVARMMDVYSIEAKCIKKMEKYFDQDAYTKAVELLMKAPRIGTTGCGHSGIMCQHFAHLMCCIELGAKFISPAEAVHGGTGFLKENDVMVFASRGGKTKELLPILEICKAKGVKIIAITENLDSPLAMDADVVIRQYVNRETDKYNAQGTTSSTSLAVIFHILQTALIEETNYRNEQFALIHPGGAVGERLNEKEN